MTVSTVPIISTPIPEPGYRGPGVPVRMPTPDQEHFRTFGSKNYIYLMGSKFIIKTS